ncbi:hypothetical protein HMPREF1981_01749 [Bacteroides pyogenes F0041]|uniref:DUF3823 domain-containing protein n=2 Tax=Bacteroides pyogenes TaxID=310300 RepID=U2CLI0_9BACE|nr:hypothetical protein HMPREF1981_01749 [Bacteroides pyogenes F0041]
MTTMINKLFTKRYVGISLICGLLTFTGCEADLTYEEAPESAYSEVGVSNFAVRSRELFENKIYAVNWNKWVDNYLDTRLIGSTQTGKWKNETGADVTLSNGALVKAGETFEIKPMTVEDLADAPEGKLHVLTILVNDHATYSTPNKGYLFDGSKFSGDFTLVDPKDNRSEKVKLPVRKNEIIGEFYLVSPFNCVVERVGDAPKLGQPGDYSVPHRYLVKNICFRPAGVEQYKRLYEVRIIFYPGK